MWGVACYTVVTGLIVAPKSFIWHLSATPSERNIQSHTTRHHTSADDLLTDFCKFEGAALMFFLSGHTCTAIASPAASQPLARIAHTLLHPHHPDTVCPAMLVLVGAPCCCCNVTCFTASPSFVFVLHHQMWAQCSQQPVAVNPSVSRLSVYACTLLLLVLQSHPRPLYRPGPAAAFIQLHPCASGAGLW